MLQQFRRFPLVAVLVLAAAVSACDGDDPADPDDDDGDGTSTVTFTYVPGPNAPEITAVAVPGEFSDPVWTPSDPAVQMTEQANGTWSLTLELVPGTYSYKYHFNGDTWSENMCDDGTFGDANGVVSPQADSCDTADNNNAVITVVDDND
jgi:hypothetical protein